MGCRILVVEDEVFVATEIEYVVEELGHHAVGIAADKTTALRLAPFADVAFVDLNLLDGPTGPEIGRMLAEQHGLTVLFMTANPGLLGNGVPGTIGVLPKPVGEDQLKQAVEYTVARRQAQSARPPRGLKIFN
ncbi:response regulator [Xaviernesmea oryzae]|uniref:Response regulator n=2 Tax=Xaviernesmea oryzae TaxID=464029 RepID=A0A1Q9B306_9HYPH|nr:response regulator [Xaviernesmea oryzae]SEL98558.1 CheY chemotaxis protein or a CheY-like REC (receiver) domain [Xaviernesmea oryzae]